MITESGVLATQIVNFFKNLQKISIDALPATFEGRDQLMNLINETYELILENDGQNLIKEVRAAIETTVFGSGGRGGEKDEFDLLYQELIFFDERYTTNANLSEGISHSEKLESGKVVLGSIQDLFKNLPKWMQRILSVINEILGFAKVIL